MKKGVLAIAIAVLFLVMTFTPIVSSFSSDNQGESNINSIGAMNETGDPKIEASWSLKTIILENLENTQIDYYFSIGKINDRLEEFKGLFFSVLITGKVWEKTSLRITFFWHIILQQKLRQPTVETNIK